MMAVHTSLKVYFIFYVFTFSLLFLYYKIFTSASGCCCVLYIYYLSIKKNNIYMYIHYSLYDDVILYTVK